MMTLTEALSEIILVKKKIEAKRTKVNQNLFRMEHMKDPYLDEGGSKAMVLAECQAISDLNKRLISLRNAISKCNLEHTITIDDLTMSIHDWLIWKREVAPLQSQFLRTCHQTVKNELDRVAKQPNFFKDESGNNHFVNLMVNLDYPKAVKQHEGIENTLQKLDGQLSLKNATLTVQISSLVN